MAMIEKITPIEIDRDGSTRAGDTPPTSNVAQPQQSEAVGEPGPKSWQALLGKALIADGKLNAADFAKALHMTREFAGEKTVSQLLVNFGLVSETDIAAVLADILHLPLATKDDYKDVSLPGERISVRFLNEHVAVPISSDQHSVKVAMSNPQDGYVISALRLASGLVVEPWVGAQSDIQHAIERMYGDEQDTIDQITDKTDAADDINELDVEQLRDMASEAPVIRLVNLIFQRAVDSGASDIHIEPFEGCVKVRFRIDGALQDCEAPPQKLVAAVISRIKIMAKLNIAERRLPQDGRMKLRLHGTDFDVRVSTVPTIHGESVVLRLLNRRDVDFDLKALGFREQVCQSLRDVLARSHGMILVTGPTGSGKTTTLYTAINILNAGERKIITVEDPVEYQLEGINQIQVKPSIDLTFANVLRSIVRQDPDVILVGEMRDLETARICVQSALTGHLVLSTLHTNSAAASITRLVEMGIEDYLLTSTLNAVISQRLVRVLCTSCREPYVLSQDLIAELQIDVSPHADQLVYRAVGCQSCQGTGYRGRQAILELLVMSDTIRDEIRRQSDASQIEAAALKTGMRTIFQDGCTKVLAGITSIDEVRRVVQGV